MTIIDNTSDLEGQPMRLSVQRFTLRGTIMRGIVAPFFAVLAALSIIFGVANATFWKPSNVVIAYAQVSGTRYIVTDPGVLNLVDSRVHVSVAALHTRRPICVAVGLIKDVRGWVAGNSVQRITGLRDWNNLSVEEMSSKDSMQNDTSTESKDANVKFQQSDLWPTATCQLGLAKLAINTADYVQSSGSASYDNAVAEGAVDQSAKRTRKNSNRHTARSASLRSQAARRVLLIDLGNNTPEASIELRWRRHQVPDFATPLYFMGGLFAVLALLAATIFAMAPHRRRNQQLAASSSGILTVKPEVREEVTFAEAFAGTMSGIFERKNHKKSTGSHARHGSRTGRRKNLFENQSDNSVKTYDTQQTRTAVASTAVSPTDSLAETAVISRDDMLAFAARFMQQHNSDPLVEAAHVPDNTGEGFKNSSNTHDAPHVSASQSDSREHNANKLGESSSPKLQHNDAHAKKNEQTQSNKRQRDKQAQSNNQNRRNKQNNKSKINRFAQQNDAQQLKQKQHHRLEQIQSSHNNDGSNRESAKQKLHNDEVVHKNEANKRQSISKNSNTKQSRVNRNGYRGNGNSNNRYRKSGKGYRGNSSNERGNGRNA